jgi:hypothetical protein
MPLLSVVIGSLFGSRRAGAHTSTSDCDRSRFDVDCCGWSVRNRQRRPRMGHRGLCEQVPRRRHRQRRGPRRVNTMPIRSVPSNRSATVLPALSFVVIAFEGSDAYINAAAITVFVARLTASLHGISYSWPSARTAQGRPDWLSGNDALNIHTQNVCIANASLGEAQMGKAAQETAPPIRGEWAGPDHSSLRPPRRRRIVTTVPGFDQAAKVGRERGRASPIPLHCPRGAAECYLEVHAHDRRASGYDFYGTVVHGEAATSELPPG